MNEKQKLRKPEQINHIEPINKDYINGFNEAYEEWEKYHNAVIQEKDAEIARLKGVIHPVLDVYKGYNPANITDHNGKPFAEIFWRAIKDLAETVKGE